MRILFQGRPDLLTRGGGDTTQVRRTADSLRQLGIEVDISTESSPRVSDYDLVHLFNSTGVTHLYAQMINAHAQRKAVALSTIYWNQDELLAARLRFGKAKWLRRLAGRRTGSWIRQRIWYAQKGWAILRKLMRGAEMLLPNSLSEARILERDFDISRDRVVCVVNGVDPVGPLGATSKSFFEKSGERDFMLSVGRIEIRKNQLALLQVLRPDDPPLVLIGEPNGLEPEYTNLVLHIAREKKVRVIDKMPHAEMGSAYAAARIHVLPSWYETPGLASMEAAVAGCPIVTTDRGCTREYFGTWAEYCDPSKPESIHAALDRALAMARTDKLRDHVLANFTWDRAARQTLEAYLKLVS